MAAFTTEMILQIYLSILAAVECLIIVRLYNGESMHAVVPVFSGGTKSESFKLLFCMLALLLLAVRTSSALSVKSAAAWRTTALVHIAEALYLVSVACGANESPAALPARVGALQAKHAPVVAFLTIVCINAGLFTLVWLWRADEERSASGKDQLRNGQINSLIRRLKLAEDKIANDKRVADAARRNTENADLALD